MRNKLILPLFCLCLLLFLPAKTPAKDTITATASGGENCITIKVDTTEKTLNYVKGTIRKGNKQCRFFSFPIKNGKGSGVCDGLMFDTEYSITIHPYYESGNLGSPEGDKYFGDYEKILTAKTSSSNQYKIYSSEKAVGNALYKAYEKGKDTHVILKKPTPDVSLKKVKKYVYTDKKSKMYSLITEEYRPNISLGTIKKEKKGDYYYTIFDTRFHDRLDRNKEDIQRIQKSIKKSDAIIKKLRPKLKGKSKKKKAFILYNYLCKHCRYADGNLSHTGYNALIKKKAVCEGYANAYAMLCNRAGINAVVLHGKNHAYVGCELGGKVYVCDPTWDDNGRRTGKTYFMKGRRSRFFKEKGHELSMAKAYLKKIDGISHHFAY